MAITGSGHGQASTHELETRVYRAETLQEAVRQVKADLGPQALVIATRLGPLAPNGRAMVEVVARAPQVIPGGIADPAEPLAAVGGLGPELARIREVVVLPLNFPEMFTRLGVQPPRGVLLYGPPGCGKTLIARTLARESQARFFAINGPELVGSVTGESERNLREVFERAGREAPSIIFIDEIDAIAGQRGDSSGGAERRLVTQLLTLMDGLKEQERVVVLAATNLPDDLDPALRRSGRFDREVEIPVPDEAGRREILRIHARPMSLAPDVNLEEIAAATHGYVGADLANLCREAAMAALREASAGQATGNTSAPLLVGMDHFRQALKEVRPSSLRMLAVEHPKVTWDDVGNLEEVKRELEEAILVPLQQPELFRKMDLTPPKGLLLAGPPGTGKTLIAKAAANQCGVNFILVNGPSLVSKYVGESEKAVREVFARARQASPCIIFFDEFDSIAPVRGGGQSESAHDNRMVAQLLVELDGFEPAQGTFILAATNRPDSIDPALLRPGRFDKTIEVPLPGRESREKIFAVHLKNKPLEKGIEIGPLLDISEGLSGAEIAEGCRRAAMVAVRKVMAGGGRLEPAISQRDLLEAFQELRPQHGLQPEEMPASRILIVDDDEAALSLAEQTLELSGFETLAQQDPLEALDRLKQERFDLLILDINMPQMNGLELMAESRKFLPNLPVIMVSGRHDAASAVQSFRLGAIDYVEKPYRPRELVEAVEKALQAPRSPEK